MIRSLLSLTLVAAAVCLAQAPGSPTPTGTPRAGADPAQQQPAQQPSPAAQQPAATPPPTTPNPPITPAAPTDTASKVASTQPVITVQGVCSSTPARRAGAAAAAKPTPAGAACKTLVTKADFEKLLNALNPANQNVAPAMRRNLAQAYVELLTFNQVAQKAGIDKDPNFLEVMRLVRMRTLEDFYRRSLEEKYRTPPAAEVQAYYNQNLPKYEEIKLSRIFIPAKNPSSPNKDDWEKKAAQVANDIHDRAAKGEDFEKLQKEAYTTLALTITPPSTSTGTRRRGMMAPQEEQELFALKAGEVSKLEQEPAGYIIYKVESKETLPVDKVKDEISRELFRQKMDSQLKSITAGVHADFNEEYFGPANPPAPTGNIPRPAPGGTQPPRPPAPQPPGPSPTPTSTAPPGSAPPSTQPSQPPPK
jgi:parvulin-like peptidyl-prolyl isomerase